MTDAPTAPDIDAHAAAPGSMRLLLWVSLPTLLLFVLVARQVGVGSDFALTPRCCHSSGKAPTLLCRTVPPGC